MKPNSPDSVLRLQTVDEKFNVDFGASLSLFEPAGKKVVLAAFERDSEKVTHTQVDVNRLVACSYSFDPDRGGIVSSGAGLGLDGKAGARAVSALPRPRIRHGGRDHGRSR